jgi:hypothetical protein
MYKKYKITVLMAISGLFLLGLIAVLSAQEGTQGKLDNTTLLAQADLETGTGAPKIEFPEDTYDFGNVKQESDVSHVFKVHNAGTAPLKIISAKAS